MNGGGGGGGGVCVSACARDTCSEVQDMWHRQK